MWQGNAVSNVEATVEAVKRRMPVFLEIIVFDFIFPKIFGGIWHLSPKRRGCQGFAEPGLSTLLYKIILFKEVIVGAKVNKK